MIQNKKAGIFMKIIGVTGGIGSGKSTVSSMFRQFGADVVDADEISRAITKKNGSAFCEIVQSFGEKILSESGEIDRKKLGQIVFSDKKKLAVLNEITHKYVFVEMEKQIKASKAEIIILDVPLLFSNDFILKYDYSVGVTANISERIKRVKSRDGLSEDEILTRMENQISDKELEEKADFIIENNDYNKTLKNVEQILKIVKG